MPSKKSKTHPSPATCWKAESDCDESTVARIARELSVELRSRDRVILEGPLGVGKSTFARALIEARGAAQPPEGSPTFAIVHEYQSSRGDLAHIDLYRLKSEAEIEDAGIPSYFWERDLIVLVEWLSLFPDFEESVKGRLDRVRNWSVRLEFGTQPALRNLEIVRTQA